MADDELPIACSLSASDLSRRLAEITAVGNDALLGARNDGRHAELRFALGATARDRIDAIVAAESRCCAFLTMRVAETPDAIVLRIDAPAGAELVVREIVDAFRGRRRAA